MDTYDESAVDSSIIEKWKKEQNELSEKIIHENCFDWVLSDDEEGSPLRYIAGMDISYNRDNPDEGCVGLIVLAYPSLEIVYRDYQRVVVDQPYVASFLAFREVPSYLIMLERLRKKDPDLIPQVIMVDGNGFLHPRGAGLATHLGVKMGIPTIGVSKNFLVMDGMGMMEIKDKTAEQCPKRGDWMKLIGESGTCWGASLAMRDNSRAPIYVSIGHMIDLETAVSVVKACCRHRIPEPIRQADLGTREFLRGGNVNRQF